MSNRYQKEPKIKLHTPFKKSLILGMKTDEKKLPKYYITFFPIKIIYNLHSWKKKVLLILVNYI